MTEPTVELTPAELASVAQVMADAGTTPAGPLSADLQASEETHAPGGRWELYNIDADRAEMHDLAQQSWALPPRPNPARSQIEQAFAQLGEGPPQQVVESAGALATLEFVLHWDAVGVLDAALARRLEKAGMVRVLQTSLAIQGAALGLVTQRRRRMRANAALNLLFDKLNLDFLINSWHTTPGYGIAAIAVQMDTSGPAPDGLIAAADNEARSARRTRQRPSRSPRSAAAGRAGRPASGRRGRVERLVDRLECVRVEQ